MPGPSAADSLRAHLAYKPEPLRFGTSGRRGRVVDLTNLEIYTNVLAEVHYLQSLKLSDGGIKSGDDFYYAYDLRPSSTSYVENRRGALCQAVEQALRDGGMRPVNLGAIPTPALAYYAIKHGKGSIMVTGSHIPFDRNGYKLNTSRGELMKTDEEPINSAVALKREELLSQPYAESLFDDQGVFRREPSSLIPTIADGKVAYIQRYLDFFDGETLDGMKVLVYQHSAVGRDLVVDIFQRLGAEVVSTGRSETFVPIDTEAIDEAQLNTIQTLYDETSQKFDAVISTDGDSDRPLLLAPEGNDRLRFFGGDLLGMVVAEFLGADSVVVPISTNDAIDRGSLASAVKPKTKIGSPYVIAGMQRAASSSSQRRVCGWEANGGFLTGSDIDRNGKILAALPTRDAMLPLLCALFAARSRKTSLPGLFNTLPHRFSRAALIREFPRPTSAKIIERFSPADDAVCKVEYHADQIAAQDADGTLLQVPDSRVERLATIRRDLQTVFSGPDFAPIARLDYTDGVRIVFADGDVAHFRPSGNADEIRIYSVADSQARADAIANLGVAEPDGLLRRLEKMV